MYGFDPSYLVALLLVCFYAVTRFNTPSTVRSQTSRFQYFGSCAAYVVSCAGLLMILTWLLGRKPEILSFLHESSRPMQEELKGIDGPLVAALVLTTLLPSFPVLRDLDAKMLGFFHKMGSIPVGAVRWAQRLSVADFTVTDRNIADIRKFIESNKALPDAIAAELRQDPAGDRTRFLFTRTLAIYVALRELNVWARFKCDFAKDIDAFEKKMNDFFAQSVGFFTVTSQLATQHLDVAQHSVAQFRKLEVETYEEALLLLSRMLLYSSIGESEVAHKLRRLGFAIECPSPVKVPLNLLSFDLIGVVTLFAVASVAAADQMGVGKAIAIGLLVSVNQSIAAMFALLPKQVWKFADVRSTRERPTLAYLISALCTITVALPLSYCFYLLRPYLLSDSLPMLPFAAQCKWLVLPTVMAVALAFACDDGLLSGQPPAWLRWAESIGLAGLMAVGGFFVICWLRVDRMALHPGGGAPPLWIPLLLSASIGGLFGATIPHWYRRMIRKLEPNPAPAPLRFADAAALRALAGRDDDLVQWQGMSQQAVEERLGELNVRRLPGALPDYNIKDNVIS